MAESYHTNLSNVAETYAAILGVKVARSSLRASLSENPYFPSLYALSNTFDRFHIEHTACKVDKENIDSLSTPFVAYLNNQKTGKDFVLVTAISDETATYISSGKKPKRVSKENFLKDWEGIVFQAQPDEHSGDKEFVVKRRAEIVQSNKSRALIAGAAIVFASVLIFFLNSLSASQVFSASLLLLIKITGLAASLLLLIYEIDKSNAFVKNICTAGKQTNCDAVLKSQASKIWGMSWSEVGFFYFSGSLLFLLLPEVSFASKTVIIGIANLIAVPYVIFSLYYQWKVIKQWCPLCLTVQGVLLAELTWSITYVWIGGFALPSTAVLFPIAVYLATPVILWYALKPVLKAAKEKRVYKAAYKRLLYNPDTFQHLLKQQPVAPAGYEHLGITVGNPNAEHTIIKVCNPYCGPCAKAHPVLDEIIHHNKNIKVKLIFTASNEENDIRGAAARHLIAISKKRPSETRQALDDWYLAEKKEYKVFSEKYPMNGEVKEQEPEIDKMKEWCDKAEIRFTPTIYINGHRLPEKYKIEELKYIL